MSKITIDAKGKAFGRLASEVAVLLQGKKDSGYTPHAEPHVKVEITNIRQVKFSGKKQTQKIYFSHTGYTGNMKTERLGDRFQKNPEVAFRKTIRAMLPKNKLRAKMIKNISFS